MRFWCFKLLFCSCAYKSRLSNYIAGFILHAILKSDPIHSFHIVRPILIIEVAYDSVWKGMVTPIFVPISASHTACSARRDVTRAKSRQLEIDVSL